VTIASADGAPSEGTRQARAVSASRNAQCSCGSGRRFKNCCGALEVRASMPANAESASAATLQRALELQRSHRLDEARVLYQEVLDATPDLPDAVHMLGVIHLQTGNYGQALPLLRRAAEAFDWKVAAARHNLGLAILAALADAARAKPSALWSAYDRYRDHRRASRQAFRGRVSIVVPSFNHARYVEAALDSLCRQTRPPDEIIVIDDGSTDGSVERIRAVLPRCPGVATFRARGNRGAAATINEAVASSSGDYVNVLNSDDRFAATRLEVMVDAVAARGAAWGFSRVDCIDADGVGIAPEASAWAANLHYMMDDVAACDTVGLAFLAGNPAVSTGSLFFSRRLFERIGGFADFRYNHDWDFCLRASLESEPEFVPSAQYEYRWHGANTMLESSSQALAEMEQMFARFYRDAVKAGAPDNRFAPLPCVWGTRFIECALAAGHATMLPPQVLCDYADRAVAALAQ
jgi:GT2 family glycosyltransferase